MSVQKNIVTHRKNVLAQWEYFARCKYHGSFIPYIIIAYGLLCLYRSPVQSDVLPVTGPPKLSLVPDLASCIPWSWSSPPPEPEQDLYNYSYVKECTILEYIRISSHAKVTSKYQLSWLVVCGIAFL